MKIINREPGGGKTHALVEIMLRPGNEDVIYVAPTMKQAEYAWELAKKLHPGQLPKNARKRFVKNTRKLRKRFLNNRFVLDEVDGILDHHFGGYVIAIAGSDEAYKVEYRTRRILEVP